MTRYTMPARSQGKLYTQRALHHLDEKDVHMWVFAHNMAPDVETLVRKWLTIRLDGFYCDLQVMYMPHVIGPKLARTHIVLNNTPPLPSIADTDEAVVVDARDLNARDTVKAIIKATGLNPHMSVCGWPFCLDDMEKGTIVAFFDIAFLVTLPGRTIEPAVMDNHGTVRSGHLTLYGSSPCAHSICVQPHEEKRKPFTVGLVRVRTTPKKATLELCDRLSNPLIEVDAVVNEDLPRTPLCDLGYGIAPGTVIDEETPVTIPDYHVLWPGKPTTNTVWTAVEDYTRFEAFSEEGCATGIACTPAPHMQCKQKTKDERSVAQHGNVHSTGGARRRGEVKCSNGSERAVATSHD